VIVKRRKGSILHLHLHLPRAVIVIALNHNTKDTKDTKDIRMQKDTDHQKNQIEVTKIVYEYLNQNII
jgi:hypothetical protein